MNWKHKWLFIGLFLLFFTPVITHAQSVTQQSRQDSVVISADPSYPNPGETVELSVRSLLVPLEGADITWSVNGEIIDAGVGLTQTQFTMPESGSTANVQLIASPQDDGGVVQKSLQIRTATIDLVWEVDTYVPPFYDGKKLYPGVGSAKVVALPFIENPNGQGYYDRENLVYRWNYNGLFHGSKSGYQRNSFEFELNRQNNEVTVFISDRAGNSLGEASVQIEPTEPEVLFYQQNPSFGVQLQTNISEEIDVSNSAATLVAYPYYFLTDDAESEQLDYRWYLGSNRTDTNGAANTLQLQDNEQDGQVNLTLDVEDTDYIFPTISNGLSVIF